MLNRLCVLTIGFLCLSTAAQAQDYIKKYIPDAQPIGSGRLSVMMFDVYDATLYAPNGRFSKTGPLALSLDYLRNLEGRKIADRSIEEMRGLGFKDELKLATWHNQMREIFPNVDDKTEITGILTRDGKTIFYRNNQKIGQINDKEFGPLFFDIWLSEKTSAPTLRRQLLAGVQ